MVLTLKKYIFGSITKLIKMTFKPVEYQFYYEGEFESLDSVPILNAHLNFVNLLVQVKNNISPESKLNVGLKGFKQGSLDVQHVIDIVVPVGMFAINNYDTIKKIIEIYTDILKLKSLAGKEKVIENKVGNNENTVTLNVSGNNNTIVIQKDAFNIYQNDPMITKLMAEGARGLEELPEINSLELKSDDKRLPSLKLDRNDLLSLRQPNPYFEEENNEYSIYEKAVLYVRKPDLNPKSGKKCIWQFVHKGRDISANIEDEAFIDLINNGTPFGQGYRIVADLKAYKKYDKGLGAYIENKKYDVSFVHNILPREDNLKADL